jgi:hypothetical protein
MKNFVLPQDKNLPGISARSALEEVLRDGARKMLQAAIENEVADYVEHFKDLKDEMNRCLVTKNGHLPSRDILTGIGPIKRYCQMLCFRPEHTSWNSPLSMLPALL